ncbi:hypothetical protein EXU85_21950 [Spirosoma sp. KCTC 42546]|uniref:hypothetical protein n=1 Tax=Spirosoma sp. KCTC 42546 TaxID=2520506 RepID=UPI00115B6F9D|nr:hypothetical protein [Spirosoma sp. KCTC 42546]QDK81132.1 hypothetical protein EXU85_21950 [Spirosoma sp. KCTC 42546]
MQTLVILAQSQDTIALALANYIRQQSQLRVEFVTDLDLITAPDWQISLSTATSEWRIVLADGRVLSSDTVDTVYSRLSYLQSAAFRHQADTDYAQAEWHAMIAGWLRHLGSALVGALLPTSLAATSANPLLRLYQLAQAGLPVTNLSVSTMDRSLSQQGQLDNRTGKWQQEPLSIQSDSVLATGKSLTGSLAGRFKPAIHQLQADLGSDLLQVYFIRTVQGDWKATDYQTQVALRTPDELSALAQYLIYYATSTTLIDHVL